MQHIPEPVSINQSCYLNVNAMETTLSNLLLYRSESCACAWFGITARPDVTADGCARVGGASVVLVAKGVGSPVSAPDGSPVERRRGRASEPSAFGSDCRGARCPTVRRSHVDTHPDCQSRREPQTRTEEKRGHERCAEEGFGFSV